jgi:hypothetical protein
MTGASAGATDATDVLRFAREVARATAVSGVHVRAALATGSGMLFDDVLGRPAVASDVTARAIEALGILDPLDSFRTGPGPGRRCSRSPWPRGTGPLGEAENLRAGTPACDHGGVRLFVLE